MELLDQWLNNIERREAIFSYRDVYQSLSSSPFTQEISKIELVSKFTLPKFELFDGTIDPTKHVLHYKQLMEMTTMSSSRKDVVLYMVFTSSLSGSTLVQFSRLPPHSVVSFLQLVELFINQFFTSIKQQKQTKDLFFVVQQKGKSIRSYVKRFNKVKIEVLHCNESIVAMAFCKGLLFKSRLPRSLMKIQLDTMAKVLK